MLRYHDAAGEKFHLWDAIYNKSNVWTKKVPKVNLNFEYQFTFFAFCCACKVHFVILYMEIVSHK